MLSPAPYKCMQSAGRLRLAPIRAFFAESLHAFIDAIIAAGTTAEIDGWSAYASAPGSRNEPHVIAPMAAHIVLAWARRVFANLKKLALGAYHGLRYNHLKFYLGDFTFRFNRCKPPRRLPLLLGIAVTIKRSTYKMSIRAEATA
jgi:ISXO2-like transposase domain